ncbi:MAG TPA: PSD1 and planctomycete cytochrome C domain-containing protein [Gemmataceae bacterium]|nr:PSD1 and planctomycete cytochrome C domain-containing protein [Gemmataceae bacterium]
MRPHRPLWLALALTIALSPSLPAAEAVADNSAGNEFFEKRIRPVLVQHCHSCHSTRAKKPKGGLFLDSREALLRGGENGPAIVPGQPEQSRLIRAIRYHDVDLQMPPKGKLPEAAIADLTMWVQRGAPWPRAQPSATAASLPGAFDLDKRKREHWAWQPIHGSDPPAVVNRSWPCCPVDQFILAKLEAHGLSPAPPADPRTLLRRLSFDLTGLPPTPAEVEAFLADTSDRAWENVVDRLLASPHFGERWARHWLDLVRYAESRGHEFDYVAPNAYQYRDYVIRAFNADVPYDQFVTEHLAGDLLPQPRQHPTGGFNESILGTGFWFLGEVLHSPVDTRQDEADRFDNMVDVMTKTFLGLTVACARCHDHKFDAISTKDYYALLGFLRSSSYRLARFDTMEHNRRVAEQLWKLREESRASIQRAEAEALQPVLDRLADYLLAARETLHGELARASSAAAELVHRLAQERQLDPKILDQWSRHLQLAANDLHDPFHAWSVAAGDPRADDRQRLTQLLRPLIADCRQCEAIAATAPRGADVVVDYGRLGASEWLPDGLMYGPGPVQPGQIRFGKDPARPIARVYTIAAAEKDPTWDGLKLVAGAENDPGALGSWVRAGRTIRTPSFLITSGKLFYLVRGKGYAYAAVDSHALIAGPLHGQLIQPIQTGDGFQWIRHDLTPYQGHHAYVFFTPADQADFAVAKVVQAAAGSGTGDDSSLAKETAPLSGSNRALWRRLAKADLGSLESLALLYQSVFSDVCSRLANDDLIGRADAADYAELADWLVQHPALFGTADGPAARRLAAATGAFVRKEADLTAQIQKQSRLAMAMLDGDAQNEHVFIRGSPKALGEIVPRRFLEALAGPRGLAVHRGSGRLELARQMIDPTLNPLLARVMVNRIWQHLFHRGIVASVDNFGVLGERPTHPELLDYLAAQFIQQGWSVKQLVRTLVLSRTYRMSTQAVQSSVQADPQDLWLHCMRVHRLEGEAIRDAMLAISGQLNPRIYGPSVPVHLTEFQQGRGRPSSGPLNGDGRRSLYLAVRRNFLSPLMLAFDTPIPFSTVGQRSVSNVPAQALLVLNDPFVHQQAERWAARVLATPTSRQERIAGMYQNAFARPPSPSESAACLDFLERQTRLYTGKPADLAAWADLAHVLFNAKEFLFIH